MEKVLYKPIQPSKVFERIAEQIETRILNGDLRTGDRLPTERELGEQFGASRTAVREAMKILAQKGLVDMRPGRGTIVINATSQAMQHSLGLMMRVDQVHNLEQLNEVRLMLEPEIAALAAERATDNEHVAMQDAIDIMDTNMKNADAYIAADNDFHRALAQATQNVFVLALVDSIVNVLSEQRKLIFSVEGGPERGQLHHKLILNAIISHDSEAARVAMLAHLRQVRNDTGEAM